MKIIGITGGTGAGKTSALHVLAEMNVEILDCDVIYHQLIQTSQALRTALTERFGDVFCADGLDRQKLGNLVFQNPDALAQLNAITMGFVEAEVHARMKRAEAAHRVGVAIDAIGLFESGLAALCDETIQLFVPGRSGRIADVWLDTAGYFNGALLTLLIFSLCRKRPKQRKTP